MKTTDGAGNVVNTYTYDAYGKTRAQTGTQPNEIRFAGEQTDDSTGLQYLRARYYDMETGRFISRDPMAHSPSWGANPFGYTTGNPVNATDPSGLYEKFDAGDTGMVCVHDDVTGEKTGACFDIGAVWRDDIGAWYRGGDYDVYWNGQTWVPMGQVYPLAPSAPVAGCGSICADVLTAVGVVGVVTVATVITAASAGTLTPVAAVVLTGGLAAVGVGVIGLGMDGRDCKQGDNGACVAFGVGVAAIAAGPYLQVADLYLPPGALRPLGGLGSAGAADAVATGVGIHNEHF